MPHEDDVSVIRMTRKKSDWKKFSRIRMRQYTYKQNHPTQERMLNHEKHKGMDAE